MAEPPQSPPSSDIGGIDRDRGRLLARRKDPHPDQQEHLAAVGKQDAARPPNDAEIERPPNSQ